MNATPILRTGVRTFEAVRLPHGRGRGATLSAQGRPAKSPLRPVPRLQIAMAMLIVVLVAGCQERLAQRDDYFAPLSGLSVSLHAETEHVVDYHRTMQAALRGCSGASGGAPPADGVARESAVPERMPGDDAHAQLCASSGLAHAAHGAPLNGYRRWVGDRVRPLPAPSETASSIGSGS